MRDLALFAVAGFAASLVDGALGMGFGPTSSSILLGAGLAPAAVSTCVNLAKVATGIVAAISHWRFKNIDRRLVLNLALPGCVGALIGVTVLSNVNGATLRPLLAVLLTVIGIRILFRFARSNGASKAQATEAEAGSNEAPEHNVPGVRIAALLGGVTNGMIGAWGPVVTPFLIHRDVRPRYAIGSVNTAEVAVASASAFSLIASVGRGGFDVAVLVAMLLGGIVAAPVAAWLIRHIPPKPMGVAVAALLLLTNGKELAGLAGIRGSWSFAVYAGIAGLVALVLVTVRPRALSPVASDAQ
jgi:uncharacterized membrane protein YfcA